MRATFLTIGLTLLALSGCASREYVKEQIDPLADRVGRLESRIRDLDDRLSAIEGTPTVTLDDLEAGKNEVNALLLRAQDALGSAQAAAARAAAAVDRADAAAGRAEVAAGRAAKVFELEQKK